MSTLLEDTAWMLDGLCAQVDAELFFPEKGGSTKDAKRVCMACPVRVECLDDALAQADRFGIRGGLSERERRKVAAERAPDTQQSPTSDREVAA